MSHCEDSINLKEYQESPLRVWGNVDTLHLQDGLVVVVGTLPDTTNVYLQAFDYKNNLIWVIETQIGEVDPV